ncbi:hypothetical protein ACLK19_05050 [Escherichia coli]
MDRSITTATVGEVTELRFPDGQGGGSAVDITVFNASTALQTDGVPTRNVPWPLWMCCSGVKWNRQTGRGSPCGGGRGTATGSSPDRRTGTPSSTSVA